jgi:hypothetical protein
VISVYLKQIGASVAVATKRDPAKWARAKARAKAKRAGTKKGKQFVKQPKKIARKTRKYRTA